MPSPKMNPKSLSYSSDLPPFLRALHAQTGGGSSSNGGPDPILAGRRRAAKKRSASEEAEDQPLIVDEHGNAVELDDQPSPGADAKPHGEGLDSESALPSADQESGGKEKLASIGAGRKRKVGRVVGGSEPDDPNSTAKKEPAPSKEGQSKPAKEKGKPKKTAKKIKLSFDAD